MTGWGQFVSKFIGFFVWLSPKWLRRVWGRLVAILWWDVLRLRRFTVFRNLTIAFPNLSKQEKITLAHQSLAWMGLHFVEFLSIPMLTPRFLKTKVVFHGIENYENARAQGKGVLFLSLHLGNGDLAVALMSMAGMPIHVISKKFKVKWLNDFWFGVREERGTRFIDPHGSKTAFDILKATSRNEGVVFVIDQFMGKPYGIETHFFGRKTGTAYGLALFALKTKAPVVPVSTYQDREGLTHIVFGSDVGIVHNENRDLQLKEMTENYNLVLENLIKEHPDQWMWVHRRWKVWE